MTVKSFCLILLGGVLVNNYVLQQFLGVSPFLGSAKLETKRVRLGLAVTVVMVLSAALTWPLQTFVLDRFGLAYFQTLFFVAIILAVVYLVELVVSKGLHQSLGVYFPLIALNSAVLGVTVNNITDGFNFVESLVSALGAGLGFLLAMVVFSGLQGKIQEKYVPKAFRGLPIALLSASIVSLALFAF